MTFKFFRKRRKYLSPKQREKRRKRRIALSIIAPLLFVLGVWGLSHLSQADYLQIDEIKISGLKTINEESLRQVVLNETEGTYFKIFSRANSFIYPRRAIEKRLLGLDTRIKDVEVSRGGLKVLAVEVTEYEPYAVWCDSDIEKAQVETESVRSECFYIDRTGYIFDSAADFSEDVYVRFEGSIDGNGNPITKRFLTPDILKSVNQLRHGLEEMGFVPIRIVSEPVGSYVVHLKNGTRILFDLEPPPETALKNLRNIFVTDGPFEGLEPVNVLKEMEKVDLRFPRRVYYKEKGAE